ncbi:MAG: hypothetical protein JST29_03965 [Bacteroidetes bacterium]|nr:hypothetical protein [Bacteroidota bacterium]MBS1590630.1 hypothetical protein [Bacteroidota bacterium]
MIKKLLSIIICCIVFYAAKSQITKGNWMVGGSGSFSSNNILQLMKRLPILI